MKTIISRQFTWSEWLDKAAAEPSQGFGRRDDVWSGGTKAEALKMGRTDGYSAAVPAAEALANAVTDTVAAQVNLETFQAAFDVAGSEVDISRFTAGVPECMVESQPIRISRAGRAIRIVVSCSYSASVSERIVRQRGAAVMALVYVLQRLQHPLEVWASDAIKVGSDRGHWLIEVQRADEPTDIGRIMYAIAHPTMLRQLAFSVEDHESETIRRRLNIGSGYGSPCPTLESDLPDQGGTTIILPHLLGSEDWSPAASVEWIEQQLEVIFSES